MRASTPPARQRRAASLSLVPVRSVLVASRIRRGDGGVYPPASSPTPPLEWGGLPEDAVYTCPACGRRHELDLHAIGLAIWNGTLPARTAHPALDAHGAGHDVECGCGLVARLVGTIGEYGKMGPYFVVFVSVFELTPG